MAASASASAVRVHIIVFPYPAHGHINPMLQLCRELVSVGFQVTFVCTEYRCQKLLQEDRKRLLWNVEEDSSRLFESMEIVGLPDGLPADFDRDTPSTKLSEAADNLGRPFESLLLRLLSSDSSKTCLISDSFLPWTQEVACNHKMPRVFFWTESAAVFRIFSHMDCVFSHGLNPFTDSLEACHQVIDYIPGLPSFPARYLPFRACRTPDGEDRRCLVYQSVRRQFGGLPHAACVFANTFHELEGPFLQGHSNSSPVHLLGPFLPLPHLQLAGQVRRNGCQKPAEQECLGWLDTKAPSSVLYISLGSVVKWSSDMVADLGAALERKGQHFLWVMRTLEDGGTVAELSRAVAVQQCVELGMGKVVEWAPQPLVLAHPAVGGFLTHGGWNSTLEAISTGVPMLVWPRFLDQFLNCWLVVKVWKIGVELYATTSRCEEMREEAEAEMFSMDRVGLEQAIGLLMQDGRGIDMRHRAAMLCDLAQQSFHDRQSNGRLKLLIEDIFK